MSTYISPRKTTTGTADRVLTISSRVHLVKSRAQSVSDGWPQENSIRVKYYLGQLLISSSSRIREGEKLQKECVAEALILVHKARGHDDVHGLSEQILIDWVVAWELRLITPRTKQLKARARRAVRWPSCFLATSLFILFFIGSLICSFLW